MQQIKNVANCSWY